MQRFSSNIKRFFSALVMISMLFNATLALMGSTWAVNNAQKYATDDIMMICTGNQFKWVSTLDYFESGEVVFVEPPAEAPDSVDTLDCSYLYIAEQTVDHNSPLKLVDANIAYQALAISIAKRPYTSYPYTTAQTRAPPIS